MAPLAEKAKVLGLKIAKDAAKEIVIELVPDAVEAAKDALKKAIPGTVDDAVLDMLVAAIKKPLCDELSKLVDKIPVA